MSRLLLRAHRGPGYEAIPTTVPEYNTGAFHGYTEGTVDYSEGPV